MTQNFDFLDFYIKSVKLIQKNSAIMIINKSNVPLYTTNKYKELVNNSEDIINILEQKPGLNFTEKYMGMVIKFSDIKDPFNGKSLATIVEVH